MIEADKFKDYSGSYSKKSFKNILKLIISLLMFYVGIAPSDHRDWIKMLKEHENFLEPVSREQDGTEERATLY